jgi:hypothetical protein
MIWTAVVVVDGDRDRDRDRGDGGDGNDENNEIMVRTVETVREAVDNGNRQ